MTWGRRSLGVALLLFGCGADDGATSRRPTRTDWVSRTPNCDAACDEEALGCPGALSAADCKEFCYDFHDSAARCRDALEAYYGCLLGAGATCDAESPACAAETDLLAAACSDA